MIDQRKMIDQKLFVKKKEKMLDKLVRELLVYTLR